MFKVDKSNELSSMLHTKKHSSSGRSVESLIGEYGEKKNFLELHSLMENTDTVTLVAILNSKFGRNDFVSFWSYILEGLGFGYSSRQMKEKRFFLVKHLLTSLQRFELRDKQSYDLIKRLCQHVSTFPSNQLIYILDLCIDGIRMGDRKYVCWKDLLPDVLKVLENQPQIAVDGVLIKGIEFRANTVNSLITMNWPIEILTSIADMFRELNLNSSEVNAVLNKFGGLVLTLSPIDLPPLAFQLFSMCSTCTEVMILVLAFDKYFYRFYYKKLFADMESNSSDLDSIDTFSDKEMREAEETVLHHLNYCTQYKIGETKMFAGLRNFCSMPDLILTPFMISSIISLSSANREPESRRITTSCLLNFLRSVIHNNEHEQKMAKYSAWFRDTLQRKQVQLDYTLSVLIDQNKNGQDVITPGLVNLAFTLLKTKNNVPLNSLAMRFLSKFIRKRFVFGHGIVKKLAEWMLVEQDQFQFGECLLMLSVADTFTVSECIKTIKYVMEFFLWLPGEQSMRMMSFILPILKISAVVRDAFIEVLRKAMSSSMKHIRIMAVYGFCMVLKQLNNSNSQRSLSNPSSFCTQNISAFSLMSQVAIDSRQYPYRYFDMLTQEIMGLLRSCFASNIVMKRVLYENLQRAVELNPKLVPHVLQFIDWHFRSFFRVSKVTDVEENFSVIFDKAVRTSPVNAYELQIQDNLGLLVQFVSHCLIKLEEFESEYDVREIKRLLRLAVEKVITKELQFEEKDDNWQPKKSVLLEIQINFLEGLMAYSLLTSNLNNDTITHILPLFKIHCKISETYKNYASTSRKQLQKNNKINNADGSAMKNITINGVVVKNFNSSSLGNIWDFHVIEKFLGLLHDDVVPFATSHNTDVLRSNVKFVRYVLEITAQKIAALRDEPKYKQLVHSKRILKYLTDITKVVYERCIRRLGDIWSSFDENTAALSVECFQQCLQTADVIYKKQFVEIFLKGFDLHSMDNCKQSPDILQNIIDEFMEMEDCPDTVNSYKGNRHDDNSDRKRILQALLQSLEVLYDNFSFTDRITIESYKWLLKFCKCNVVNSEKMSLVHKLLFTQRQKTHAGAFFNTIALQLCIVWGAISNEFYDSECPPAFTLKSLTMESAKPYFLYLCQALRKQIDDVEHFILKANNLNFRCRIVTDDERDMCLTQLRSMERSICSQLLHISNALKNLVNACIPLGSSMDQLLKLLMQHYICLKNLTKHFLSRVEVSQVCMQSTKFEFLLRAIGKCLPTNIYALISYIEENVIDKDQENHLNPKADGAKILRETKLIPKVVLHLESFNRFVIILSKKTNSRISNLLHQGTVHDFRFRTHALTAAVQRTFSLSREISVDFSDENMTEKEIKEDYSEIMMDELPTVSRKIGRKLVRNDEHSDNINEAEKTLQRAESKSVLDANSTHSATGRKSSKRKLRSCDNDNDGELFSIDIVDSATRPSSVSDNVEVLEHESNQESASQLFKNLAKINKKAKKRGFKDIDDNAVLNAGVIIPPKKRRDRTLNKK